MKKLEFIKKSGFIIGIIVLLMAVMPMSGGLAVQAVEPEDDWYYKPGDWIDYAMSGMPDFDQKQDNWWNPMTGNWSYCGPVAVANSLWWFDSRDETGGIPPPTISDNYGLVTAYGPWDDHNVSNVEPLVNDLAYWMDTDGQRTGFTKSGTDVMDMQWGIDMYLLLTGYYGYYYEKTELWPDFYWIEDEVERCEDVVLLLGFYQSYEGWYERIGGHYVTVAGVNSNATKIGISDPYWDNAEAGWPGRVPVAHNYTHSPSVHNDTQYVSHDTYDVVQVAGMNLPLCWALPNYTLGKGIINILNFAGQNGGPVLPNGSYFPEGPEVETIIDYAVAVSPKPDLNDYIDSDYNWTEEQEGVNVSVRVHVTDETWNDTIYDMEILFWTHDYGTEWVKTMYFDPPLQFCENYTFNVWYPFAPEEVVLHFSDYWDENIGFAFSYPAEEPEPEEGWYWKPGNWTDYALSGMPDFDQKQDEWGTSPDHYSYCGPTSVANSLWWFDSRAETGDDPPPNSSDSYGLVTNFSFTWGPNSWDDHDPSNVIPLVDDLAMFMNTHPYYGTDVMDMQAGIREYLNATGYNDSYYEVTVKSPDFYWIEEEVERCEDVILLLGFWLEGEGWYRIGGHYVTVAGVNSDYWQIALSDPYWDNAGAGWPGRVPVAHTYPHGGGVHNNATLVSHDSYDVIWDPCPGGNWSLANYSVGKNLTNFIEQNWAGELWPYFYDWYEEGFPVHTQIDYAVAVSPIVGNATLVGNVTFPGARAGSLVEPFEVKLFEAGNFSNVIWSGSRTTNSSGMFNITGLTPDTYDIGIKSAICVSEVNFSVTLSPGTNVVDFTIRSGDCDDNDYVDMGDYSVFSTAFNTAPMDGKWDAGADLDRNDWIDMGDYSMFSTYFNELGHAYGYF